MNRPKRRVLCLDIEGGFGGSSRSLFYLIKHMDRARYDFEVWCKRPGPIQQAYQELGIPCRVMSWLPKVSSLPRFSRNVYVYTLAGFQFLKAVRSLKWSSGEIMDRFDLVHFNHEALFLLAAWLRKRTHIPFVTHIRTMLKASPFSRFQYKTISRCSDRIIFITENERENFHSLAGSALGEVVFNISEIPERLPAVHPLIPRSGRLRVAHLSNYSWHRATDRLIDLSLALQRSGRENVLFVVAGNMRLQGTLPGQLGRVAKQGGTLEQYVNGLGLDRYFLFLGHVAEVETVLAGCDLVIRPSRGKDPWGRDVIEAMAHGKPVIATGIYDRFVEDGINGYLFSEYDSRAIAEKIIYLQDHPEVRERMGEANRQKARRLFNGPSNAARVASIYESLLESSRVEFRTH